MLNKNDARRFSFIVGRMDGDTQSGQFINTI